LAARSPSWQGRAVSHLDEVIARRRAAEDYHPQEGELLESGVNPEDRSIFAEEPVPLDVFIRDKGYLGAPRLSDEQFRLIALGEAIYFPQTFKLLDWGYTGEDWWRPNYTELVAEWGKGSGKDFCARIICCRIPYLLMCLADPQEYYNQDAASAIDILNVAVSSRQANDIFFEPFKRMIGESPWFSDKYDPKQGKILFDKNVTSHSGHGEQESLEGFNLMLGVADEIAAFKTKEETRARVSPRAAQHSADAIAGMMRSSGQSRFPGIAKVLYISYPRYRGDYIEQMYEKSLTEPSMYGSKKATWEVNPTKKQEHFVEEYRKDPDEAEAKYECKPPAATNKFFRNDKAIEHAFKVPKDRTKTMVSEPVDDLGFLMPDWRPEHEKPMCGHIDLALTKDRAAIALCHMQDWNIRVTADGHELKQPIIFVDLITSFSAAELHVSELDIDIMEDLVLEVMLRGGRVRKITADQFQSRHMLQHLQKQGIECENRSVDRDLSAYNVLKSAIYQGRMAAYYRERVVAELKGVKLLNGVKVDHEPGASKDEADALAGAVTGVTEMVFENIAAEIEGGHEGWADDSSWHDPARSMHPWSKRASFAAAGVPLGARPRSR
jgi:hypothetical protein